MVGALAQALLIGGCAIRGLNWWNPTTAEDVDEGYAVLQHVKRAGVVPESADIGRSQTASKRMLFVVGVEDVSTQDAILEASEDARRLYSTKTVVVLFHSGRVVKDRSGGATYPDGLRKIRRVEIP